MTSSVKEHRCLFVVLVIGESYSNNFELLFRKPLEKYCQRCGYDLVVRDTFISKTDDAPMDKKKFLWERLLIPQEYNHKGYDFVVSIDADMYISENAPPLPLHELGHRIGAVNERKLLGTYEYREMVQRRLSKADTKGRDWYALSGHTVEYDDHINSGLVVYRPEYHADIMSALYKRFIGEYQRFHQDDQSVLSHFLMENDMIHWLDGRFNCIWHFWRELVYPCWDETVDAEGTVLINDTMKLICLKNYVDMNYFCHMRSVVDTDRLLCMSQIGFI